MEMTLLHVQVLLPLLEKVLCLKILFLSNNLCAASLLRPLHQGKYPLHGDDKSQDLLFPFIPQKQWRVIIYDAICLAD